MHEFKKRYKKIKIILYLFEFNERIHEKKKKLKEVELKDVRESYSLL